MAYQLRQVLKTLLVEPEVVVLNLKCHVQNILVLYCVHTYQLILAALKR